MYGSGHMLGSTPAILPGGKLNSSITGLVSTSRAMRSTSAFAHPRSCHRAQRELEVFPLANILDARVLHSFECAMDGLPLRVEDSALQRDVNMRLHRA